jgi:DNA-binding protein YbaB
MTVDHERIIEQVSEEYEKVRAHTEELRREITALTASATAPRETVKVTVGAQGDVRSIEFPAGAYKRMAPAELSAVVLATINEARDKVQRKVSELMAPEMPPGVNFLDILQGKAEMPAMVKFDRDVSKPGARPRASKAC